MPKIKICGLRRQKDIEYANTLEPDYIGFVFADSKRQVHKDTAALLKKKLADNIKAVGVFVYDSVDKIAQIANSGIIDIIQLHGDETPEYCCRLRTKTDKPIIKVIRVKDKKSLMNLEDYDCDYFLLDTFKTGKFGGVGQTFDYNILADAVIPKPFFMAGGLTVENVSEIIFQTSPYGVDVSGGVEIDGYKDFTKMTEFVYTVKAIKAKE